MLLRTSTLVFLLGAAWLAGSARADDNYDGVVVTAFGTGGTVLTDRSPRMSSSVWRPACRSFCLFASVPVAPAWPAGGMTTQMFPIRVPAMWAL